MNIDGFVFNIEQARKRIKTAFQRERFAQSSLPCIRRGRTPGLNSSYAPDRFIGDLDYALMRLADPKDIVAVTVRMLANTRE